MSIKCFMLEPTGETRHEGNVSWPMYRRADTGEVISFRDAPPGAMTYATWMEEYPSSPRGPDGRVLIVKLPNGRTWIIDGRAGNCDRKDDNEHRCWCRHGTPPLITVDKTPEPGGSTCNAGAGSIQAGDYHGFLRNGELTAA